MREYIQPGNTFDIVFEKANGYGGTVNKTSVYAEAAVRRVLWKRLRETFRRIHHKKKKKKHLCRNLFFDKVKFCRSVTLFKRIFSL